MIKEQFFPTTIYGKDTQLDNNTLANHIINWSKQDQGVKKTNMNGWHSTTDMHTKQEYSQLVSELCKMQEEIYQEEIILVGITDHTYTPIVYLVVCIM